MTDEPDYPDLEERNNQLNDPINDHVPVFEPPDLGISRTAEDTVASAVDTASDAADAVGEGVSFFFDW